MPLSACTLALSLPKVCVYPDSTLKFLLAYDPRNHAIDTQVSQQMFQSYPASLQARLGTLAREYKVLRGSELIALGTRDCNAPKPAEPGMMVAPAGAEKPPSGDPGAQKPLPAGMVDKMLSVFGLGEAAQGTRSRTASLTRPAPGSKREPVELPLPPPRPAEFAPGNGRDLVQAPPQQMLQAAWTLPEPQAGPLGIEPAQIHMTVPYSQPGEAAAQGSIPTRARQRSKPAIPPIITGAQPILPPRFLRLRGAGLGSRQEWSAVHS
jgi:hypothetical protein